MAESFEKQRPLSAILADVAHHDGARISVAELTQLFGGRAIGALLFVFGLACMLPLPPGATTIFGFPLVVLAPQLIIGASAPWLPAGVKDRTISTADLKKTLPRFVGWLRRVEAVSRPRLALLFGPLGERLIGVVCLALALVLILPIPGGNILPALSVSALSFALIQRDGVIALVGYAMAITSASILVLAAHIIVRTFTHFWAVISGA
ncbi:MAG: exopolysaccharide biosynthesis protein [Phenylobacterium sp.]|uniref:exopolysaccharide biosynthesis protein n=1 Tax=Phenylobacterium sp. TaxID=1871053 RepID=UPI001A3DE3ED|nr:exopolysaccharide biosynthesis protein [Phenylobacterium sp.]MBL8770523.1 exopolysaccharide biosynthesis protein [Phenylobacterium sp.]